MSLHKRNTSSVFYRYVYSYLGIALFSCALIGIVLFNNFAREYRNNYYESLEQKARLAVEDMQTQVEALEEISYLIGSDIQYRSFYLEKNNYYELEMLTDFTKYIGKSVFSYEYFLLYKSSGTVYRSRSNASNRGSTYDVDVYLHSILHAEDTQALRIQIEAAEKADTIVLDDPSNLLLCYPIKLSQDGSDDAVLCFLWTTEEIADRVSVVSGGLTDYVLLYNGSVLYNGEKTSPDSDVIIEETSSEDRFSIQVGSDAYNDLSKIFLYRDFLFLMAIVVLIIFGSSFCIAYFRYSPIAKLNKKLMNQQEMDNRDANELHNIERVFDTVLKMNRESTLRLKEQMTLLRHQAVHLLISGDYDVSMQERLDFLQIKLENRTLFTGVVRFRTQDITPEALSAAKDELVQDVEDLSSDEISFYGCRTKESNEVAFIVALQEMDSVKDAEELITSLIEALNLPVNIGFGGYYYDIRKLHASFLEATFVVSNQTEHAYEESLDTPIQYNKRYVARMVGSIRLGEFDNAKQAITLLQSQIFQSIRSQLMLRYVFSDLTNELVRLAQQLNISITPQQISTMLSTQDDKVFFSSIESIVEYMCDEVKRSQTGDNTQQATKVLEYIRAHYLENDLSLEKLSSVFNLSASYLSRLIKTTISENYKDYVTRLKIDFACQCLKNGASVTETCEQCGYINISHFIKTFKQRKGTTPSVYRRQIKSSAAETSDTI